MYGWCALSTDVCRLAYHCTYKHTYIKHAHMRAHLHTHTHQLWVVVLV